MHYTIENLLLLSPEEAEQIIKSKEWEHSFIPSTIDPLKKCFNDFKSETLYQEEWLQNHDKLQTIIDRIKWMDLQYKYDIKRLDDLYNYRTREVQDLKKSKLKMGLWGYDYDNYYVLNYELNKRSGKSDFTTFQHIKSNLQLMSKVYQSYDTIPLNSAVGSEEYFNTYFNSTVLPIKESIALSEWIPSQEQYKEIMKDSNKNIIQLYENKGYDINKSNTVNYPIIENVLRFEQENKSIKEITIRGRTEGEISELACGVVLSTPGNFIIEGSLAKDEKVIQTFIHRYENIDPCIDPSLRNNPEFLYKTLFNKELKNNDFSFMFKLLDK